MFKQVDTSITAWSTLWRELDLWHRAGNTATFWWRDDDAVAETVQLHRLDALSRALAVPVSLAVIPACLDDSLPRYMQGRDNLTVLQHGYAHSSYAARGVKKIEIGGERSTQAIADELADGCRQLRQAFGGQFFPVLVPPWNRIEKRTHGALADAGFVGVSSMWARRTAYPVAGLLRVNAHIDPVHWRRDQGFVGEYRAIAQIHRHLYARRSGRRDSDEPTGLLTHHLVQKEAVWGFCDRLIRALSQHPAVRWLGSRDIWAEG